MIVYRFEHPGKLELAYSAIISVKMKIKLILKARLTWIQHTPWDLRKKDENWYQCCVIKSSILTSHKNCSVYFKIHFLPISFTLLHGICHAFIDQIFKERRQIAYIRGVSFCFLPLQRENALITKTVLLWSGQERALMYFIYNCA